MRNILISLIVLVLLGSGALLVRASPPSQATSPTPTPAAQPPNASSPSGEIKSPVGINALTGKTMSNPYCYQPDPTVDQCFINVRYYQASDDGTTSPYLDHVLISIGDAYNTLKVRGRENLFFENNIYYSYDMAPGGYKVQCGAPNAGGGGTSFGKSYYVRLEPFDTSNNSMGFDQAFLYCPAYAP